MSAHDLKVGDVVRLKSGGPKMTVSSTMPTVSATITCIWFVGNGEVWGNIQTGYFEPASLRKVVKKVVQK